MRRPWLGRYKIANSHLHIDDATLRYWRALGLPMYLFVVVVKEGADHPDCYYKRFTTVLTTTKRKQEHEPFYKVNSGATFLAFANEDGKREGFVRDLFIDFMRWSYYRGSITYLNPRKLGLQQFKEKDGIFPDILPDYKEQVCATYSKTKRFLENYCGSCV
jgi:hypothetical protein